MNLEQQMNDASRQAKAMLARVMAQAADENRPVTPTEKQGVQELIDRAQSLKARIDRTSSDATMTAAVERLTGSMGDGGQRPRGTGSIGQQFLNSETYRWLKEHRGSLPTGSWTSPSSEIMAATLTTDSASGGALLIPDHRPGIVETPTRPLTMSDLIAPGTTDGSVIQYMKELAFTNEAAAVAPGTLKPESTLTFTSVQDPVVKIAHWIPVVEELLEDASALESYLDARMRLGVLLREDDQLLNGTGIAPELTGFLARANLATPVARGTDTNADALLKQISAIFTTTTLQPTGIVMNPANWITIQLAKATDNTYLSGGTPFQTPPVPTLWGLPVALTAAIASGTALVGAFKTAAQIFRKGGLRVESSNSHASFFTNNLVAIRAEERLALAVYRPAAFGTVTGLT